MAKIWAKHADRRRELREQWSRRVIEAIPGFTRPGRFGHGESMTVASGGDYRHQTPDGRLDLATPGRALKAVTDALSTLAAPPP